MSLCHAVFAQCAADAEEDRDDPLVVELFLGLAYGLYPMCVTVDDEHQQLLFRRSLSADEKDKARRLAAAAEDLQAIDAVRWYHETQVPLGRVPLHVQPGSLSVPWPIDIHGVHVHRRVVPGLLAWCRWTRDAPWAALRRDIAKPKPPLSTGQLPRHVRLAQVLDYVGTEATARGESSQAVIAICRRAAERWSLGHAGGGHFFFSRGSPACSCKFSTTPLPEQAGLSQQNRPVSGS